MPVDCIGRLRKRLAGNWSRSVVPGVWQHDSRMKKYEGKERREQDEKS